jgi:hypothetical protein
MEPTDRHEGGCFCEAVRYGVRGPSVWKAACCCRSCVKMHGAPYVVWAGFERGAFALIRGEPVAFRSSPHVVRRFCPRCGTALTYEKDAQGNPRLEAAARIVYIAVPTLDYPETYPPDEVVRWNEHIKWLDLGDKIPLCDVLSASTGHLQVGGRKSGD